MGHQQFFEAIKNPNWKSLDDEAKQVVLQSILRFFINPLCSIDRVQAVRFSQGGMNIDTFFVWIDGRQFVFVPGQDRAVLGWDSGLSGLRGLDCSEERQELRYALKQYICRFWNPVHQQSNDFSSEVLTTQGVAASINEWTSDLREVDIPAMLVEVKPSLVGLKFIGSYSVVTGNFTAPTEVSEGLLEKIRELIIPQQHIFTPFAEYPRCGKQENVFIQQQAQNEDLFDCYVDEAVTYQDIVDEVESRGMSLLSTDEWEYCCGGTSRRLFRWGNTLHRSLLVEMENSPLWHLNLFGLTIAAAEYGPELVSDGVLVKGNWIEESYKAPILNLLPFSTYYQLKHALFTPTEVLKPGHYCVRRVIHIEW